MVFYLEACESGSIFEGLLPEGLNIFVTTASNAEESSWGTYCPGKYPSPLPEYETCLDDLYIVTWMEDSNIHNLKSETLHQQYELVKTRTTNDNSGFGSHVMQYGDVGLSKNNLFVYMGINPANENFTFLGQNSLRPSSKAVNQRDADLVHFWHKYSKASAESTRICSRNDELEIAAVNKISDPSLIRIGHKLWIPLPCSCDEVDGERGVHYGHVVVAGSSVEAIATEYGTTQETLPMINGISDPKTLQENQVLDVPLKACSSPISNESSTSTGG
ncbi:hypothetical protein TB1_000967 [Malus domestica]